MILLILRRITSGALLLLVVLSLVFAVLHLAPGEPLAHLAGPRTPPSALDDLRRTWGLDDPLPHRWWRWMVACARGDWGTSYLYQEPVGRVVQRALGPTLLLGAAATAVQLTLGIGLGALAALGRGRLLDHGVRLVSLVLYALPSFWLALVAIFLLSLHGPQLPSSHLASPGAANWSRAAQFFDHLEHLTLPALVLGLSTAGFALRLARNSFLETMTRPWMLAARARGQSRSAALWRHGLPNAAPALLQLLAVQAPALLGGSLVVEIVFSWPGLGRLTYEALSGRDLPVVLATTAVSCTLVVIGSLIADLLQLALDPRQRRPEVPG